LLSVAPPRFAKRFLKDLLDIEPRGPMKSFCVLRDIPGSADARWCGPDCGIWFETKIVCGSLHRTQISRHRTCLRDCQRKPKETCLQGCKCKLKRLVLLTPDDGNSEYIRQILSWHNRPKVRRRPKVLHLEWRKVYDYLGRSVRCGAPTTFSSLVRQFLDEIHDSIFEHDFVGIIQKVAFGDWADLHPETFIEDLESGARGKWRCWDTPQKYEKLDGKDRKLLLYDSKRKAIVAEAEIRKVKKTNHSRDFPWSNFIAPGKLRVYGKSKRIPLEHILTVPGYENFVRSWSGHWNVTHEQYRRLRMAGAEQ